MHFDENSFFAGDKKEANKLKVIILYFNLIFRYKLLGRNEYKPMFLSLTINIDMHPEIIRKIRVLMFLFLKKRKPKKQVQLMV